jgi:purine-binding chemotaxis protein CheW
MANSLALRLVTFRLGPLLLAAPATVVREVVDSGPATRIPGAARAVSGLVNLRGTLLTVVDGRRALGLADSGKEPESVLVVESAGRAYGLAVDAVLDLIDATPADLAPGAALAGVDARFIRGLGHYGGQGFAVLDTEAVLAPVLG